MIKPNGEMLNNLTKLENSRVNCEARISDSRACPLNSSAKIGHEFNIKPVSMISWLYSEIKQKKNLKR